MSSSSRSLPRSLVLLMALATGVAAASNYYAQPLLHQLMQVFHTSERGAGWVVTTAQLAYAAGLLLLVPLGDRFERRGLIVVLYLLSTAGLVISALSTHLAMLLAGTALTGLCSVAAQVLVPFASTLAAPEERGRTVGTVMSGLLLGILLARTAAGLLAGVGSWHTVYAVAAGVSLVIALLLWRKLPRAEGDASLSYGSLIGSVLALLRDVPVVRMRAVLGLLTFSTFSVFWTTLAFLLSGPKFGYSTTVIGLFGLVGAAGAMAASLAGKLSDRGRNRTVTYGGLGVLLAAWAVMGFASASVVVLVLAILLLDVAVQGVHISNQNAIYQLDPALRSRITSAYMTCYFIGGAIGSATGAFAWSHARWTGVVIAGAVLSVLAMGWAVLQQRNALPDKAG